MVSRAQNRGFCAFFAFGTPVFWRLEHKIEVFVRFCPPNPPFLSISSTKSAFLCSRGGESGKRLRGYVLTPIYEASTFAEKQFAGRLLLRFPMPFLSFPLPITSLPDANPRLPEHKIGVFVLFWPPGPSFSGISSTKSRFLCAFSLRDPRFRAVRAQNRGFCALLPSGALVFRLFEHKIGVFVLVKLMCGIGSLQF